MRILFTRFPLESHFGGAEVQTLSLMKGLRERGHEVAFLGSCPVLLERCSAFAEPTSPRLRGPGATADRQVSGVRCQELRIGSPPVTKWGAISFLWRQYGMRRKLIEQVSGVRCQVSGLDTIFMLSLSEKLLLTEWAVSRGIKVFWVEHDRVGRWLTKNPWLPKLRKLSKIATTIVVSDLSRDLYLKLGWDPGRTVTIPNGIDVKRFGGTRGKRVQHVRDGRATFHMGCIARLTRDKGVDLLIEAVSALPNLTLTIVGQGREEIHLRTLAEQVNEKQKTKNAITIHSSVLDIPNFYHSLDALVLPSREHDPFGLVVAEAMAAGVPTIVTDACGIARYLERSESLIIPAGNVEVLRQALVDVQGEECRTRLSQIGPRVAEAKFSLARMIEAYTLLLSARKNGML